MNYSTTTQTGTSASTSSSFAWGRVFYVQYRAVPRPSPVRRRKVRLNAFTILGLPPGGASIDMCRQRFRELAKVLHPDTGGDVKWMAVLNRAYDAISEARA